LRKVLAINVLPETALDLHQKWRKTPVPNRLLEKKEKKHETFFDRRGGRNWRPRNNVIPARFGCR